MVIYLSDIGIKGKVRAGMYILETYDRYYYSITTLRLWYTVLEVS